MVDQLRLAAIMGCTLNEMKNRVTPFEFCLWQCFFEISPPVGERLDFHFAQTQALLVNLAPKKQKTRTFKLTDFYIDFHKSFCDSVQRKSQSTKEVASQLMTWALAHGGKPKGDSK